MDYFCFGVVTRGWNTGDVGQNISTFSQIRGVNFGTLLYSTAAILRKEERKKWGRKGGMEGNYPNVSVDLVWIYIQTKYINCRIAGESEHLMILRNCEIELVMLRK